MDESDLLERGEVDALFHAAEPRGYVEGHPRISRLFEDSKSVEQAYYRKTGIFPIMHAVAGLDDAAPGHLERRRQTKALPIRATEKREKRRPASTSAL